MSTSQDILKLAEKADPEGSRTTGVLTKPDLSTEAATRDVIIDLVLGKRNRLELGYYIVKNRGIDDNSSMLQQHANTKKAFFIEPQ
jgi:hypothetical protein